MENNSTTAEESGSINTSTLTDEYNSYANSMNISINQIMASQKMLNDMMSMYMKPDPITIDEIDSIPDTSSDFKQINSLHKRIKKVRDLYTKYTLTIALKDKAIIVLKNIVRLKKLESILCEQEPKQSPLKRLVKLISWA